MQPSKSLIIAIFTIVLIVSFTYFTTQITRNNILESEKLNMTNTTRLLSERIHRVIFSIDLQVTSLQEEIETKSLRNNDAFFAFASSRASFERMQEMLSSIADVDALAIIDSQGRLVSGRQWQGKVVNISNREYFKVLRDNPDQPYFLTKTIKSKVTGENVFVFARRLTANDGSFLGLVIAANSISRFDKAFLNSLPDDDATLHLFKHNGSILSFQSKAENISDQSAAIWQEAEDEILNADTVNLNYEDSSSSSKKRLVSLANVSGYPLTVALTRSEANVLAQWQKQAWLNILFTVMVSLLVILATWAFRKQTRSAARLEQMNSKVEVNNQRLNEAQSLAKVGSWELEVSSGNLFWTDEIYQLFEIDKKKFVATYDAFLNTIHPDDRDSVNAAYTKSLEDRSPYVIRHRLLMPDGRIKWVEERCSTDFDTNGKSLISRGTMQDISESKQAEQQLKKLNEELEIRVEQRTSEMQAAMAKAEQANAAKSDFLSRMSHELRTPLNAILGFGQLLQMKNEQPMTQIQADNVNEIVDAGSYLLNLVNEILDLSRIESGLLVVKLEPIPVFPMLEHCVKQVKPLAAKRDIIISLEPFEPCTVNGDVTRLKEVLFNLLGNAIKYNREGGSIRISCSVIGKNMRFRIQDTGKGIPAELLSALFKPFGRLESSYSGIGGTGVGLALVKKLVQGMHGTIGVESVAGEGSTFWFELPVNTEIDD